MNDAPSTALVSRFTDALWDSVQHVLTHEIDLPVKKVIAFHLNEAILAGIRESEKERKVKRK